MLPLIRKFINTRADKALDQLIGTESPGAGATTNLFAYLKLLEAQIGVDNPVTADQTTVMNFLKQIKDSVRSNVVGYDNASLLIPVVGFDAVSRTFTSTQTNRLFAAFTSPYTGYMALKIGYNKITDTAQATFIIYEDNELGVGAGPSFSTIGDYPAAVAGGFQVGSVALTTIQSATATIPFYAKAGKRYSLIGTSSDGGSPYTSVQITSLGLYGVII